VRWLGTTANLAGPAHASGGVRAWSTSGTRARGGMLTVDAPATETACGWQNENWCQVANPPSEVGAVRLIEAVWHRWSGGFGWRW
jgi:hypothetical protein